ncbi:MAG: thioesterase family protein [Phototrophicales bacterium]|nr:MAG: thioesterase [Phototrophicales bacterium]RMG72577.1 MAG: thioesterase [Chloroflexota bacterium]
MDKIKIGIKGTLETTVTPDKTARHLGSGGIDVFATPAMVALMEGAAVAAIDPLLPEGQASVGIDIHVKHLAATPLGKQVRAEAEVTGVDRRKVMFIVRAWDEHELIGEGEHIRFIIDLDRYIQRLAQKINKP